MKYRRFYPLFIIMLLLSLHIVQAQESDFPRTYNSSIQLDDSFDRITFSVATTGTIQIRMIPTGDSELDTMLYLLDRNDIILSVNDDVNSDFYFEGSRIVAPVTVGDYSVIATRPERVPEDRQTGDYILEIFFEETSDDTALFEVTDEDLVSANYPALEPRPQAAWTILAFYGGDTDLEGDILGDAHEFELGGGSNEQLRIVALIDRTPEYTDIDGNWTDARIYEFTSADIDAIQGEGLESYLLRTEPLVDNLGELDTGNGLVFTQFLTWGMKTYPADNYILAIGGHGAGWAGIIADESDGNSSLSLSDMRGAFESLRANEALNFDSFGLLINDACLMASVEYYTAIRDYADVSIGSAELTISPAHDMTLLTSALRNGEIDPNVMGRDLVDTYINRDIYIRGEGIAGYFTSSVTDLTQFDTVTTAIENFATVVNSDPQSHVPALSHARANSYTYNSLYGATNQIDIGDFMRQVIRFSSDFDQLIPAAEAVVQALNEVRVYGNSGNFAATRTSYYNIFFPLDPNNLSVITSGGTYFQASPLTQWSQMLLNYFAYAEFEIWTEDDGGVTFHIPDEPQVAITRLIPDTAVATFNLPIVAEMELVATNVSRGSFVVDQVIDRRNAQRFLLEPLLQDLSIPTSFQSLPNQNIWRSGVEQRRVQWSASAFRLSDGTNADFEYLQKAFDSSGAYFLEGQYRRTPDDEWSEVKVTFGVDPTRDNDLRSFSFISLNAAAGTFGVFSPEEGAELQVFQQIVHRRRGSIDREPGNIYTLTSDGLVANLEPVPSGDYELRFEVETFGRGAAQDTREVTVNNDDIRTDIRGQNFINEYGFTAGVHPSWEDFRDSFGNLVSNTYESQTVPRNDNPFQGSFYTDIFIYNVSDIDSALSAYLTNRRAPLDTPIEATYHIDGRTVNEFSYTTSEESARGLISYDPDRDITLIFAAADRAGNVELTDQLFELLSSSIAFYEPVAGEDLALWDTVFISDELSMPVLFGWIMEDAEGFTYFRPDSTSSTFIAYKIQENDIALDTFIADNVGDISESRFDLNYSGERYTWDAAQYVSANGKMGRIYKSSVNDLNYIIWMETPVDEAVETYETIFEPMVSGTIIDERYYAIDWLDTLGLRFDVPSPTLETDRWYPTLSFDTRDVAAFEAVDGSRILEVYVVPDHTLELVEFPDWLIGTWENTGAGIEIANVENITVAGMPALQFEATLDIEGNQWSSKYAAVINENNEGHFIIGVRGRTEFDEIYTHLLRSVEFGNASYTEQGWLSERPNYDPLFAFDVFIPVVNQPVAVVRNYGPNTIWMWTASDQGGQEVYIISEMEQDYRAAIDRISTIGPNVPEDTVFEPILVDGYDGVEFGCECGFGVSRYIVVYDSERSRMMIAGVFTYNGGEVSHYFPPLRESFTIFALSE